MDDDAPLPTPPLPESQDPRLQALLMLRDELQALNARLEYAALMLRLSRLGSPQ